MESYNFRDPFRIATVNSRGYQFVLNEQNRFVTFTIREAGPTDSHDKDLYLVISGMENYDIYLQYGYNSQRQYISNSESISLPSNTVLTGVQGLTGALSGGVQVNAWYLGRRDWRENAFVEIYYGSDLPESAVITLIAVNPNRIRDRINTITEMVLSPIRNLFRVMGESALYHTSFVNYQVDFPVHNTGTAFFVTASNYSMNSNRNLAVQREFGANYRVADWNDLKKYQRSGGDVGELFRSLGLDRNESVFVTLNNQTHYTTGRAYFASFHQGRKPSGYLAHDQIDRNMVSLGSWDGERKILVIRK